jgi:hypothetical protein
VVIKGDAKLVGVGEFDPRPFAARVARRGKVIKTGTAKNILNSGNPNTGLPNLSRI